MKRSTRTKEGPGDGRRALPSVDALLDSAFPAFDAYPRRFVVEAIRETLAVLRSELGCGAPAPSQEAIMAAVGTRLLVRERDRLRPAINATGIVLHTGLGRAVLPEGAVAALAGLDRCCNLQVDLETGLRGKRNFTTEQLICELTGAEAALVVNNNAAATLLILSALCFEREVIVSRGQLIEIGGSFRLPDCVHQSGATLVEVGATNKTHLHDYERAITEDTAAVMRVNPSNYRVIGFSKEVPVGDLAALKKGHDLVVIDDLGCGALIDLQQFGLPHEPTVPESIAAGSDIVCFSGDKLIGGPQAGIVAGRKDLIARIRKHPLTRMMRVGKLTDLALERTLRLFLEPESLVEKNPTLRMLAEALPTLKRRARRLQRRLAKTCSGLEVEAVEAASMTGGGALPGTPIPTYALALRSKRFDAEALSQRLRLCEPPVIARIEEGRVMLDMRTLLDGEDKMIEAALGRICAAED